MRKKCYRNRALRMALGLTQEEVAAIIGVSIATVSMYERDLIDGVDYDDYIDHELTKIRNRKEAKIGYWYKAYIDNKAALHEIEIYMDLEGTAPIDVINYAKACAQQFVEV